jgi:hypothetical protein
VYFVIIVADYPGPYFLFFVGVIGVEEITMRLVTTHTRIGEGHSRKGSIVPGTGNVPLRSV